MGRCGIFKVHRRMLANGTTGLLSALMDGIPLNALPCLESIRMRNYCQFGNQTRAWQLKGESAFLVLWKDWLFPVIGQRNKFSFSIPFVNVSYRMHFMFTCTNVYRHFKKKKKKKEHRGLGIDETHISLKMEITSPPQVHGNDIDKQCWQFSHNTAPSSGNLFNCHR